MAVSGPERTQCVAGEIGQRDEAVFVALASPDMDAPDFSIDIADLKCQGFAQTQTHGIGSENKHPIA
jgi:hypothetical protein